MVNLPPFELRRTSLPLVAKQISTIPSENHSEPKESSVYKKLAELQPLDYIALSYLNPFLVCSDSFLFRMRLVETNSFRLMKRYYSSLPIHSQLILLLPKNLTNQVHLYESEESKPTINFPLFTRFSQFRNKGEGQGPFYEFQFILLLYFINLYFYYNLETFFIIIFIYKKYLQKYFLL